MSYAFGDSDLAAERLRCLAAVFAGSTHAFLTQAVDARPGLAVDLGCGPGDTTHFLAEVLRCHQTVGIDSSPHFIAKAQETATERVTFRYHDFTDIPFPDGSAELLYARFVLTHMADPKGVLEGWATQLRPNGLMLLEETEWIHTSQPAFATYLRIVEALLAHQANILYIGTRLNQLPPPVHLRRRSSHVATLPVTTQDAARMFSMNIQTWKHNPYIQTRHTSDEIARLEQELLTLTAADSDAPEIEWGLRQLVFQRD